LITTEQYILDNFNAKTNKEIALALNLKLSYVRKIAYSLGLFRIELEFWTSEQVNFLKENYEVIGDTELANIFQEKFKKTKTWNKKQIEKKRKYLNLKRTTLQIRAIRHRNIRAGMYDDAYKKRKKREENTIVYWNTNEVLSPFIKIEGKYYSWSRWTWIQNYGKIENGLKVVFKDGNNKNLLLENLELVTHGENARRNAIKSSQGLSDKYVAAMLSYNDKALRKELLKNKELLETKRLTLKIKRICKSI
jgi:hypothetical protein